MRHEYERATTIERVRRNKRQKARDGKVVGGHHAAYGYRYAESGDGYEVDEPAMRTVRSIFEDIAGGAGIRTVKERLDKAHVPTPRARGEKWSVRESRGWSRPFLKNLLLSDLYRPHTLEELKEVGVSETVLAALDESAHYGVYRFDGIPVPVPGAGIDLAVVERARAQILSKSALDRKPSKAANRVWELSGGVLRCEVCSRSMLSDWTRPRKTTYFYYRCASMKQGSADRCEMLKNVPTEKIEAEVWDRVR